MGMQAMEKPVLSYDVEMGGDRWVDAGGYCLWTRTLGAGHLPLLLWKMSDGIAAPLPTTEYVLHNIRAGLPHRLAHAFGFWRISEGDTIFLKSTEKPDTHYTLALTTGAPQYRGDTIAWFCPKCGRELASNGFETRRYGVGAFWDWALERAREFNAAEALRTCGTCGALHSPAYGLAPASDDAAESEARASW
jgi:hypothetical protein